MINGKNNTTKSNKIIPTPFSLACIIALFKSIPNFVSIIQIGTSKSGPIIMSSIVVKKDFLKI